MSELLAQKFRLSDMESQEKLMRDLRQLVYQLDERFAAIEARLDALETP